MTALLLARLILVTLALISAVATAQAQPSPSEIVAPATRDVTPPGVTPGPAGDGPLVREPAPPRPPDPPRWRKFFLPKTTDSATLHAGKRTIRISGVKAPSADATCRRVDGSEWPCGRAALYAFRMFIGGRAVECYFPHYNEAVDITAPCRIGRMDLGLWLVSQGWVMPDDLATDDYREAAAAARCKLRGLWRWTEPPQSPCSEYDNGQATSSPASARAIRARVSGMP